MFNAYGLFTDGSFLCYLMLKNCSNIRGFTDFSLQVYIKMFQSTLCHSSSVSLFFRSDCVAVASAFRSCTEDQVLLCRIHTPNGRHPSGVGLQTVPHPAHRFPPGSYVQGSPSFLHCSSFTLVAYPLLSLWFPYYPYYPNYFIYWV